MMAGYQRLRRPTGMRIVSVTISIAVCLLIGVRVRVASGGGSCSEAKLCCPGRDSSCVVQKTLLMNAVDQDSNEKPCYCDHACLKLDDCCDDFKKSCHVVDCLVSVWRNWSECDANCGTGITWRTRTIVKHPLNGGRHCPSLIQRRACLGTSCAQNPSSALKEIAMLLPAQFSKLTSSRRSGPFDLQNDVAAQNRNNNLYCVLFRVVKATKACKKESHFSALSEGEKVCVQCDSEAMRPSLGYRCGGHGTMDRSTSWSALSAPHCHGKWVRLRVSLASPSPSPSPSQQQQPQPAQLQTSSWSSAADPLPADPCRRLCAEGPRYVFV
ncbi:somatomedin-B and thrombospondin type-1 domain-containing protein [Planococcus citri]|uniref:somatomedin-B and thrombospondin type-1 domain-containing protein n=1 Tax=Planococcus citri TaxID=170843 RepID=UPI0031F8708A